MMGTGRTERYPRLRRHTTAPQSYSWLLLLLKIGNGGLSAMTGL